MRSELAPASPSRSPGSKDLRRHDDPEKVYEANAGIPLQPIREAIAAKLGA